MKTIIYYAFSLLTAFSIQSVAAQQTTVTGTIYDNSGSPLSGASIQVKGSTNGTASDNLGHYSIKTSVGDTLVFSYLGFQPIIKIVQSDRQQIDIIFTSNVQSLDAVVVVGYGSQKKRNITGAISSVKMDKVEAIPSTNFQEMLRGQAPGLQVHQLDNRPGGRSSILIRGQRSILGGNAPLFIVDGVPVDNINNLNTLDIASIEVLKDASAQAIYGARAANGVILVTTKRGIEGKLQVSYNGYYTVQKLVKNFDLYSAEEFAQLRREAHRATNFINTGDDRYSDDDVIFNKFELESLKNHQFVNWENLIMRNAIIRSHNVSLRGGTEKSKYYGSLRFFDQDGVIPTSGYSRGNLRFNFDQKINDKINLQANLSMETGEQNIESSSLNFITLSPLAKPFNKDGSLVEHPLGPATTSINPLWNLAESENKAKTDAFHINVALNYQILKNLKYRLNTAISRENTNHDIYLSKKHSVGANTDGKATIINNRKSEYLIENILNYHFGLGEGVHNFDITAMQSVNQIKLRNTTTIGTGFSTDELGFNGLSQAENFSATRTGYRRRLLSYMGRIRYSLFDKYLVTLTGRYDGSSVFAADKKWGFFPSAAVAWKIGEEDFLKNSKVVDQLKLRASYGSVGNEAISPYQTLGLAGNFPYVFGGETAAGFMPGDNLPNPNLTWETSTTFNLGVDFSLSDGLISGSIDYYKTHTRDLLVDVTLPGNTGYSSTITNGGESENSGIEARVTANIIRNRDLSWSLTATFAHNDNKILKTGLVDINGKPMDDIGRRRFIGHPINVIYQKKFDGIFQTQAEIDASAQKNQPNIIPGDVRVIDKNGDGKIDDDDNFIFSRDPDWVGAISTSLRYKGFELLADLYIVQGSLNLNPYLSVYENGGTLQGILNGIKVPYWTPEHHSSKYPRPQSQTQSYLSALAVQSTSYVRLRTLQLGYNVPSKWVNTLGLDRVKVYVTATNLFTITDYKSYSPEINPNGYPDSKDFTIGLNVGF